MEYWIQNHLAMIRQLTAIWIILLLSKVSLFAQDFSWTGVQVGFGSSWMALPRTHIANPDWDGDFSYVLANAETDFTVFAGVTYSSKINISHLHFTPEINVVYVAGNIIMERVSNFRSLSQFARGTQRYVRLEVPLVFEARTDDQFSVMLGPIPFVNVYNNRVIEAMDDEFIPRLNFDATNPIGLRIRIGISKIYAERYRIVAKWDFDTGRNNFIEYKNETYEVRFAAQSISVGINYLFR